MGIEYKYMNFEIEKEINNNQLKKEPNKYSLQ